MIRMDFLNKIEKSKTLKEDSKRMLKAKSAEGKYLKHRLYILMITTF